MTARFPDLEKPIIQSMVQRHVEEAAFLWQQRDYRVRAHDAYYADIEKIDRKLTEHILGISAAELPGWRCAQNALNDFTAPGEMFVAAMQALTFQNGAMLNHLLKVASDDATTQKGLLSALAWSDNAKARPVIKQLFESSSSLQHELGIAACSLRRINPGSHLDKALDKANTHLQLRALRSVGQLGLKQYQPKLQECLMYSDQASQFWAAWSLVLLGDRTEALEQLCAIAQNPQHLYQESALRLAIRALPFDQARRFVRGMAQQEVLRRQTVIACGIIGSADSLPWLIQQMKNQEVAQLAGDAFTTITGLALEEQQLCVEANLEDADIDNTNEGLPWPDTNKLATWWQSHQSDYMFDQRYLLGRIRTQKQLSYAFKHGTQTIRRGVAADLALSGHHPYLQNTSAMLPI